MQTIVKNSTTIAASYREDGFYLYDTPLFSPDLIERARLGMDAIRAGQYETGRPPCDATWKPGDDPNKLCKIENPQLASCAIREFLKQPALGKLVAAATGAKRVQIWWVQLLYKPPATPTAGGAPTSVGWHQDRQYWGGWEDDSELLTAWIALSDVRTECGPMRFARGSHRWGFLNSGDFFGQDNQALRATIPVPQGRAWEEVPTILPPGGVSLHHKFTFHASDPNVSNEPRRSFAVHLRTENSRLKQTPDNWVGRYLNEPEINPVIYEEAGGRG